VAQQQHSVQAQAMDLDASGVSAKLAGAQWLKETTDDELVEALALRYQLVSAQTNFILVHKRAEDDKADGMPALAKIPQMQAAGWGGASSVSMSMKFGIDRSQGQASMSMDMGSVNVPSVWRANRTHGRVSVSELSSVGMEDFEIPAFLCKQPDDQSKQVALAFAQTGLQNMTPKELLDLFMHALAQQDDVYGFVDALGRKEQDSYIYKLIDRMSLDYDCTHYEATVLLFTSLSRKLRVWGLKDLLSAEPSVTQSRRALRTLVAKISPIPRKAALAELNSLLTGITATSWHNGYSVSAEA
jgi:hypothetical protein